MFEVGVIGQFEAAHQLVGNFGPATRIHGHTYRVEASVRGPALREDGTLCDITVLQGALQDVLDRLHFRNLNEIEGLAEKNTTADVLAHFIWEEIAPHVAAKGLHSLSIRVWESPQAYAGYDSELTGEIAG